jgi:GNAT superfamily N-acetyltransferase
LVDVNGEVGDSIAVRRLTSEDALIAACAIAELKQGFDPSAAVHEADRLQTWLKEHDHVLLAALDRGRPVGFALGYLLDRVDGHARMLFFYEIEVLKTYRRRGIGMKLVEAMKDIARIHRVAKMWVQTDPNNAGARALYEQAGGTRSDSLDEIYTWTTVSLDAPRCP